MTYLEMRNAVICALCYKNEKRLAELCEQDKEQFKSAFEEIEQEVVLSDESNEMVLRVINKPQ